MDGLTDIFYRLLINPMSRGIGDHQSGQGLGVLLSFLLKFIQIDIAVFVTGYQYNLHADHLSASWISPMG